MIKDHNDKNLNSKLIIVYLSLFLLLNIIMAFIFIGFSDWIFDAEDEISPIFAAFTNLFFYVVLTLVLVWVSKTYLFKNQFPEFKNNLPYVVKMIVAGFLLLLATNLSISYLLTELDIMDTSINQAQLQALVARGPLAIIPLIIFSVLLAPIAEELVFRKGLYGLVKPYVKTIGAIVISAFVFGFIHIISEPTNLIQLLPYFAMGLSLGLIYHLSGEKIIVPIAVHFLWNLLAVSAMLFL